MVTRIEIYNEILMNTGMMLVQCGYSYDKATRLANIITVRCTEKEYQKQVSKNRFHELVKKLIDNERIVK